MPTRLGQPQLLSYALGMRVMLRLMRGDGLDEPSLRRALGWRTARPPSHWLFALACKMRCCWPGPGNSSAHARRCWPSGGAASSVAKRTNWSSLRSIAVLIEIWRGNFTDAALVAEDAMERALQAQRRPPAVRGPDDAGRACRVRRPG